MGWIGQQILGLFVLPVDSTTENVLKSLIIGKKNLWVFLKYPIGFNRELYPDYGLFLTVQITVGKTDLCINAFF